MYWLYFFVLNWLELFDGIMLSTELLLLLNKRTIIQIIENVFIDLLDNRLIKNDKSRIKEKL